MVTIHVNETFRDVLEHVDRRAGDTFIATESRAMQIDSKLPGYITYEAAPEDESDGADLSSLKVTELKAIAKERGLTIPKNATKAQLVGLLKE